MKLLEPESSAHVLRRWPSNVSALPCTQRSLPDVPSEFPIKHTLSFTLEIPKEC